MRRAAVFLIIVFILVLAACSAPIQNGAAPYPSASATPDTYTLSLANLQAQSTLEAMRATSQAIEAGLTATAYQPTNEAIQTATAQAWLMTSWTATASVGQTATAASGTATGQSVQATGTQQKLDITATLDVAAASAQVTALHGQAVSVELAVERERAMNNIWAVTPWAALVLVLIVFSVVALRRSRVRPIFRDPRGDAPLLIVDGKIYDADRNPQPLLDLSGKKPVIPALTDPALQAATTARDQMIDLATRGETGAPEQGRRQGLAKRMADHGLPPGQPDISVISAEASRPLLRDVLPGIVRDTIDVDIFDEDEKGVTP